MNSINSDNNKNDETTADHFKKMTNEQASKWHCKTCKMEIYRDLPAALQKGHVWS